MRDLTHARTCASSASLDQTPSINIRPSTASKNGIMVLISFPCYELTSCSFA